MTGVAESLIHARGLVKRFGDLVAVDGIDLDVQQGEAFGFLGPNGAGKSSTMRMIGCVSPVTEGTLRILGRDPATDGPAIRARLGVVPQQDTLDFELTVRENVLIYGRYFGLSRRELRPRIDELLDFVQLTERAGDKVEPLSGGMKRRLTIARSLVNDPDLLLLDEPTTGLDPQARHVVWDRLFRLKQRGKTFVVTTHYMDEAEQLCDRLVVMDHGRIVAEGSPWELIQRYSTREVVEVRFDDERPQNGALEDVADRVEELADRVLLYTRDGDATAAADRRARPAAALDADPARHAGGRLPAPDRPDARRLGTRGERPPAAARLRALARAVQARLARDDRDEPRQPDPLPDRARRRARHARRRDAERARRRPVPRLRRARACSPPPRCRPPSTESSWPVMAAIKWSRVYHAMIATPLTERDAFVGHQLFVITRVLHLRRPPISPSSPPSAPSPPGGRSSSSRSPCCSAPPSRCRWPRSSARVEDDRTFVTIFRFLIVPMFLFSGTFFPVSQLPLAFELVAYVTPIWHGVELCRMLTLGDGRRSWAALGHVGYLLAWTLVGFELARRSYRRRLLG